MSVKLLVVLGCPLVIGSFILLIGRALAKNP